MRAKLLIHEFLISCFVWLIDVQTVLPRENFIHFHYNWSTYYFADSYALHNLRYSCELQVISNGVINNEIIIITKHYLYIYIFIQVHSFVNTVKTSPKLAGSIMIFNYLKVDNFCTCKYIACFFDIFTSMLPLIIFSYFLVLLSGYQKQQND